MLHRATIWLRRFLDARLQPSYLALVSGAVVAVGFALGISLFFTAERGKTAFGIPLGSDFAGFYVAAEIMNQSQADQLYDRALHNQLYHELLPAEDQHASIPYVHPPFVAGCLRPLAYLPYPVAVAIWQLVSFVLYVMSVFLLARELGWDRMHQGLIVLLALSFEPFLFECWLGGQLSAIAFTSFALCWIGLRRGQPLVAGMALGICFYKPTILLLVLPLLVIGRQWRVLLGMTVTGCLLVLLSVALVGWDVNVGYLNVLLSFQKSTTGGDLEIRTWKYVDLNNCLRLMLGDGSPFRIPLFVVIAAIPFWYLARLWWRHQKSDETQYREIETRSVGFSRRVDDLRWAVTITFIPVLNLYFGIYDSILIVQSVLLTAGHLRQSSTSAKPLTESGLAYLTVAIYAAPWFSQNLAARSGISLYTLLLVALGVFQLRQFKQSTVTEPQVSP